MTKKTARLALGAAVALFCASAIATPPYGDPDQAYDRLPGTLETYHVPWASPLADKLTVLFIVPYYNSREVVELRQRLDLDYTVIMNVGKASWSTGYAEGVNASPIQNGATVLDKLSKERLDLKHRYDCILIGKVSWEVIPQDVKELILQHVKRGTGLVYVSPHRSTIGWREETPEATTPDPQYESLFQQNAAPELARALQSSLPFDLLPLKFVSGVDEFQKLPPVPSSPMIRGDPHVGFALDILRISSLISLATGGRPGSELLLSLLQWSRNLRRCQAMTVAGFTKTRTSRQPGQILDSQAQSKRSAGRMRGRLPVLW